MTSVLFDAETGTNGTTLTTGNSGFDAVTVSAGAIFSTAAAAHGTLGYRFTESGTHANVRIDTFQGAASRIRCAFAIRISAAPSGALQVSYWTDSPNAALLPRIIINTTRTLGVQNAGSTTIFTGATALALNTWYRVELVWIPGATSTTGTIGFGYALLDDPINSGGSDYFYATNVNTGTADGVGRWTLPKLSGSWTATVDVDDIRADDTTFTSNPNTWLGPAVTDVTITGSTAMLGAFTPNGLAAFDTTVTGATALLGLLSASGSATAGADIAGATALLGLQVPAGGVVSFAGDFTVQGSTALLGLFAPAGASLAETIVAGSTALLGAFADAGAVTASADVSGATALLGLLAPAGSVQADATRQGSTALLGLLAAGGRGFVGYKLGVWDGVQWKPVATAVWDGTQWLNPDVTVTAP